MIEVKLQVLVRIEFDTTPTPTAGKVERVAFVSDISDANSWALYTVGESGSMTYLRQAMGVEVPMLGQIAKDSERTR